MNAMARLPSHVVQGFMCRLVAAGINPDGVHLLEASTQDLRYDLERKKVNFAARNFRGRRGGAYTGKGRLEENYFYGSRRFPSATNNTIGSGALVAGSFPYFNKGLGDDGSGIGFPTGTVLTQAETNLDVGGYLPQGSNFVGAQLGVTFNSDIATADLAVFLDVAALNFSKAGGQFNLLQGPLKFWPGGHGVSGYSTATSVTAAHNGAADVRAVRSLRIPRVLREKEVFSYSIFISRTTKATNGGTIALTDFVIPTIWLFGGQKNAIPT